MVEKSMIEGLPRSTGCEFVNLQYADDTLIFGNCDIWQAITLKRVLSCFEIWSGVHINYHRSSMVLLSRRSIASEFIAAIMDNRVVPLPITYLGIPIWRGKMKKREWLPLIDKVDSRVGKREVFPWVGGKCYLMQSWTAMPIYFLLISILPKWVCDRIDRTRCKFLWSGQSHTHKTLHLVSWDRYVDRK